MSLTNAFWKIFESTGHIGAYLLYKDYSNVAATCQQDEITENLEVFKV
ncbi:MAG: YqzL family protein [Clostridia bacterium]|nr:YqzL family protein [Clostridia bacterium]